MEKNVDLSCKDGVKSAAKLVAWWVLYVWSCIIYDLEATTETSNNGDDDGRLNAMYSITTKKCKGHHSEPSWFRSNNPTLA